MRRERRIAPVGVIARKRDGYALSPEEIAAVVRGYARDEVPDYQMAALTMAVYCRGMTAEETAALTREMWRTGATLDWSSRQSATVDKHSTGGVGDKVSLVLAPLLASCGLQVPMISGRGLGTTGGTLDKLESIPGFRTELSLTELRKTVQRVGCAITGATREIAPADRKLYALRDVTATVGSIPLITASILSKKLAEGLSALVLDVKFGSGALMKSVPQARGLARSLVSVAVQLGLPTTALLTDMNQPLGRMAGNALEVNEAVETLCGDGPDDLVHRVLDLGTELLRSTNMVTSSEEGRQLLQQRIDSGQALETFHEMVRAQGGNLDASRPLAPAREITSDHAGYVAGIDAERLGSAIVTWGGGRRLKTDLIDHSVGLEMLVRLGDAVDPGQPLLRIFAHGEEGQRSAPALAEAIKLDSAAPSPTPLVAARVTHDTSDRVN